MVENDKNPETRRQADTLSIVFASVHKLVPPPYPVLSATRLGLGGSYNMHRDLENSPRTEHQE